MGKMFFAICFLACFVILANGKDIIKIGNETISEEDITPTKLVVDKVFEKRYNRSPNANDTKIMDFLKFELQQKKLISLLCKIIDKDIKNRYFDRIVTDEVLKRYIREHGKDKNEDLTRYSMFLAAADEVKKSSEKNKYRVIYDKYEKKGLTNSYKFFQSAVENEAYLKHLRLTIERLQNKVVSAGEKNMIFMQMLRAYVIDELSEQDPAVKAHLVLDQKHSCGFRENIYMRWYITQGENMGVKVLDARFGNSLQRILLSHTINVNKEH